MSGGERAGIAAIATKIAEEIAPWLKWKIHAPYDQNFSCNQVASHATKKTDPTKPPAKEHNHPVDSVYSYIDPYTDRTVAINTDLKSYAKDSIKQSAMRTALKSLAQSIDCARYSIEWKEKYSFTEENIDIRGMLFVYNHDGDWDGNFHEIFYGNKTLKKLGRQSRTENENDINIQNIGLQENQQIHILDPNSIKYIKTVIDDLEKLHSRRQFNKKNYQFFYPDLNLHKVNKPPSERPATLELVSAPFMIIEYQGSKFYDEEGIQVEEIEAGYKIYYREKIRDWKDLFFLIDSLSNYQILNSDKKISIRPISHDQDETIKSHFRTAKNEYTKKWGKTEILNNIEFEPIATVSDFFSKQDIGWNHGKPESLHAE
ncbi:hypothetical protein [Pseudomonas germanica]|uniref:hypothetical protein n=1 Tax=Pseudomonas germanica TaxID=2815720 RepID=UPI002A4E2C49|nr:hypothetical protein [Pseudomonas germanica]WPN75668.1 hypothetical protein QMK46_04705 [Pseudomonas germanica]